MEISLIATEQWIQRYVMLYSYNGKIFRNKKECSKSTSDNMDESQRHHGEVKSYSRYYAIPLCHILEKVNLHRLKWEQ